MMRAPFLFLLLLPGLTGGALQGHKEYPVALRVVLSEADSIVRARVSEVELDRARCYASWTISLETVARLKGAPPPDRFTFSYDVFYPRKADYPWQKDCPNVHYSRPPVAPQMKKGSEVVAMLKRDKNGRLQATGTASLEDYARHQP